MLRKAILFELRNPIFFSKIGFLKHRFAAHKSDFFSKIGFLKHLGNIVRILRTGTT